MEFINATRMVADCAMGVDVAARESLVVIIKGTFVLPRDGEPVRLADEQCPLTVADTFTGDPGRSAPIHESDYAPRKRFCDVLLLGSAHAPGGRPVTRLQVGLRVDSVVKHFDVLGERRWIAGMGGIRTSAPAPFDRQPVSYDVAFGGVDQASADPEEHAAYDANPVGRGFHKVLKSAWVDGRHLPLTERPGEAVSRPDGRYAPMAFGPVGRGWTERRSRAGTYDQAWRDEVFPFLPKDFDDRYFQAAPSDQQLPLTSAPVAVALLNLTPDGLRRFEIPHFEAPVHVFPRDGGREDLRAVLDTIVFMPDEERFTLCWRAARPLRRNMLEVGQVLIGRKEPAWWQAREVPMSVESV